MTDSSSAMLDPLVDEVRERRRRMLASFDDDLEALYEAIRRRQQEHPERVVDQRGSPGGVPSGASSRQ